VFYINPSKLAGTVAVCGGNELAKKWSFSITDVELPCGGKYVSPEKTVIMMILHNNLAFADSKGLSGGIKSPAGKSRQSRCHGKWLVRGFCG
jgi:hypothetical protein